MTRAEFLRIWDNKFRLTESGAGTGVFTLRVTVTYVTSGEHVAIALHPANGVDDVNNWFVGSNATDRAHELGHQLGLFDEYVDADVVNRATAASPGVFSDHSIMGNYYVEGARPRRRSSGSASGSPGTSRRRRAAPSPRRWCELTAGL